MKKSIEIVVTLKTGTHHAKLKCDLTRTKFFSFDDILQDIKSCKNVIGDRINP